MNSKQTFPLLIFAGLTLVLVGCNHSGGTAYVPKPTSVAEAVGPKEGIDQNYIPLGEGKQWTYVTEIETESNRGSKSIKPTEINYKIVKVETTPEGKKVTWDVTVLGKITDRQVWTVTPKGIFQVAIGPNLNAFTTPQPVMVFPVKDGDSFNWKGSGLLSNGVLGSNEVNSKVLGVQEVDTDLGRMKGLAIESKMSFATSTGKGVGASTIWVTPGVGIVRFYQLLSDGKVATKQSLRLKSHS